RIHLFGFGLETREHPRDVEVAGLHGGRRQASIEEEELLLLERWQIPTKRRGIPNDLPAALFECDEDPGSPLLVRTVDQRFQGEHSLPRARPSEHERRPTRGDTPAGDLVESGNAGSCLVDWRVERRHLEAGTGGTRR